MDPHRYSQRQVGAPPGELQAPGPNANRAFGLAKWLVLLSMVFVTGIVECDRRPDPPPAFPRYPLALDCVSSGTQVHVPIEISVDPDRYAEVGQSLNVSILVAAFVPQEAFCSFVDAGFISADLAYAEVTANITGVTYPISSEVRVLAPDLPIFDIDFANACAGLLGPQVKVQFAVARTTVTPNGSDTIDFWLAADGIDVGFTNLTRTDMTTTPGLTLLELCTPTDKSEPPNGTLDDPEDSPRIAADTNGDGTYDAWATPDDQIQISVQGGDPCMGFPCDDGNECTDDYCDPADGSCTNTVLDGEACDLGGGSGLCVDSSCQPFQTKTVPMGCTNGVTSAQDIFPFKLTVATTPIEGGAAPRDFTAQFGGVGMFPKFFLDAAQSTVPGGVRSAIIEGFTSTVSVRSGATGADVQLGPDESAIVPGPTPFCTYPSSTVCTVDGDCIVPPCKAPVLVIDFPVAEDCGPGGVCEGLGQGYADGPAAQCNITDPPEFCVTGDQVLPMASNSGVYTPDGSGVVLFGWAEDPLTITCPHPTGQAPQCVSAGGAVPDGGLILPVSIYGDPVGNPASIGLNGIRLNIAGALFVALQCNPGLDGGACSVTTNLGCLVDGDCPAAETCIGVGVDDDIIMPSPDSSLIYVPIENTDPIECNGEDCNDGQYCTLDACEPLEGGCVHMPTAEGSPCSLGGFPGTCISGSCVSPCEGLSCDDGEQCTVDSCNGFYARCDNLPLSDTTTCDFGGLPGACEGGQCKAACDVVNCDDGNDCTADSCSPSTGACSNISVTDGSSCDFGGFPGVCASGVCEDAMLCAGVDCDDGNVCTDDACDVMDGLCDSDAVVTTTTCDYFGLPGSCSQDQCVSACEMMDCDDGDDCTDDACNPHTATCSNQLSAEGAVCDAGYGGCQVGTCVSWMPQWTSQTKTVTVGCYGNTPNSLIPFELEVRTTPIIGGPSPRAVTSEISGTAFVPMSMLDLAQGAGSGGARTARVTSLQVGAAVRSGAGALARLCRYPFTQVCTADSECLVPPCLPPSPVAAVVSLGLDESSFPTTPTRLCTYPTTEVCTADSDCIISPCLPPVDLIDIPQSSDCSVGGVCDLLGKTGPASQCEVNGFCVTGSLPLPLTTSVITHVPEESGVVLFGWGETIWEAPIQMQLHLGSSSSLNLNCTMAVGSGNTFGIEHAEFSASPDSALVSFAIDSSQPIWCDGINCNDGLPCTTDSCNLADNSCQNLPVVDGSACDATGLPGVCVSAACLDVCDTVNCEDFNECTSEACDPTDGLCHRTALDGSSCDFGGLAGVCVSDDCASACEVVGCDDANDCTSDICDPLTAACDNPIVGDDSPCDFGGFPGICFSGLCEDAMLCDGVDCDDGNICTADSCDPMDGICDHLPEPSSISCDFSGLAGACVEGDCVSACEVVDCVDGVECTEDACDPVDASCSNDVSPNNVLCDGGFGRCESGVCNAAPPEWSSKTQIVTVGCTNGVTAEQEIEPYELTVRTTPIEGGVAPGEFTAEFHGVGVFPQFFLDAAQSTVPGGVRSAFVEGFTSTVSVRSGATGPDIELGVDELALVPGPTRFCLYPSSTVCTVDGDCIVPPCQPPVNVVDFPISEDCGAGGICESLGQGFADGPAAQCNITDPPEFCVTGDLLLPMASDSGVYRPFASGEVLFGWAEDPLTITSGGGLILPASIYGDPIGNPASVGLIGSRLNFAGALFVATQCSMATAGGTCTAGANAGLACATDAECPSSICDLTVADVLVPSPDSALISFPIDSTPVP